MLNAAARRFDRAGAAPEAETKRVNSHGDCWKIPKKKLQEYIFGRSIFYCQISLPKGNDYVTMKN